MGAGSPEALGGTEVTAPPWRPGVEAVRGGGGGTPPFLPAFGSPAFASPGLNPPGEHSNRRMQEMR